MWVSLRRRGLLVPPLLQLHLHVAASPLPLQLPLRPLSQLRLPSLGGLLPPVLLLPGASRLPLLPLLLPPGDSPLLLFPLPPLSCKESGVLQDCCVRQLRLPRLLLLLPDQRGHLLQLLPGRPPLDALPGLMGCCSTRVAVSWAPPVLQLPGQEVVRAPCRAKGVDDIRHLLAVPHQLHLHLVDLDLVVRGRQGHPFTSLHRAELLHGSPHQLLVGLRRHVHHRDHEGLLGHRLGSHPHLPLQAGPEPPPLSILPHDLEEAVDLLLGAHRQDHPLGPVFDAEETKPLHDLDPGLLLVLPHLLVQPVDELLLARQGLEVVHQEAGRVLPHLQVTPGCVWAGLGPSSLLASPAPLAAIQRGAPRRSCCSCSSLPGSYSSSSFSSSSSSPRASTWAPGPGPWVPGLDHVPGASSLHHLAPPVASRRWLRAATPGSTRLTPPPS